MNFLGKMAAELWE